MESDEYIDPCNCSKDFIVYICIKACCDTSNMHNKVKQKWANEMH